MKKSKKKRPVENRWVPRNDVEGKASYDDVYKDTLDEHENEYCTDENNHQWCEGPE